MGNGRTGALITTSPAFGDRPSVFGGAETTTALLDRPTRRCAIVETGTDGRQFENRA